MRIHTFRLSPSRLLGSRRQPPQILLLVEDGHAEGDPGAHRSRIRLAQMHGARQFRRGSRPDPEGYPRIDPRMLQQRCLHEAADRRFRRGLCSRSRDVVRADPAQESLLRHGGHHDMAPHQVPHPRSGRYRGHGRRELSFHDAPDTEEEDRPHSQAVPGRDRRVRPVLQGNGHPPRRRGTLEHEGARSVQEVRPF